MAKLSEIWQGYQASTETLSQVARPLGFAAAGVAWVLRAPDLSFAPVVKLSLLCTVGFFAADLLQYYVAAGITFIWARRKERQLWKAQKTIEGDLDRPHWLDVPARVMFHTKVLLLLGAFISLGAHVL